MLGVQPITKEQLISLKALKYQEIYDKHLDELSVSIFKSVISLAEKGESTLFFYQFQKQTQSEINRLRQWNLGQGLINATSKELYLNPDFLNSLQKKVQEFFPDSRVEIKPCFLIQAGKSKYLELNSDQPDIVFEDPRFCMCLIVDWTV